MLIVIYKMRYSIEPRGRIYLKGYELLSFAKIMDKYLWDKYSQKRLDTAKKSTTNPIKIVSKRTIKKKAEAICDLIGNKIADKMTSVSKKSNKKLPNDETEVLLEQLLLRKDEYLQKKDNKLLMNWDNWWIGITIW